MTSDPRPTRWAGLSEPMTVLTNVLLGGVAFVLGARLCYRAVALGTASVGAIGFGLIAASFAAMLGAAAHGLDPLTDGEQRDRCWRAALTVSGLAGAASIAAAAFFAARGLLRTALLAMAAIKFLVFIVVVTRQPKFRVAAADYGIGLTVLFVAAVSAMLRGNARGMRWIVAGVIVSLVAGVVQARRVTLHRHFNHNDLYHVIQIVALYFFYRGGEQLVDR